MPTSARRRVLSEQADKLEAIAQLLMTQETIEGEEMEALFDSPRPTPVLVGPASRSQSGRDRAMDEPRPAEPASPERDRPGGLGTFRPQPAG